jgi:transcriptional regulator with XRE-family HTH domain
VSIGDTLAQARRQAGLTLAQVSQQTRIRESIISSIEQGDFSSCGGDFYARGHIRSIASVVGTDPVALIREYDEEHGAPGGMRAAQIFESATPIRIREPRPLHLGWVFGVAVAAAVGFGAYHYQVFSAHSANPPATATSRVRHIATAKPTVSASAKTVAHTPANPRAVIRLTAVQDCWVGLSTRSGQSLYRGTVLAGSTMTWHEKHAVSMVIGNPPGIVLTVNGKPEQLNTVQVVRLSIDPFSKTPVTVG